MTRHSVLNLTALLLMFASVLALPSCLKDPDDINNNPVVPSAGRARLEITDAPIDDPNVKGVFVTVVDVKIDGESWEGFDGKTTFDLLAYQNGQTKLLGEGELKADTYSEIVLVLDTEEDSGGNSPGCYVKDAQGNKQKLGAGSEFILRAKGSFETLNDETTEAVIDVDLRKSIVYETDSDSTFQFVTDPELQSALRLMDKDKTGSISGDCTDGVSGSDKVIVFVYEKGDFDVNERYPQGASQIQFKNAVSSAVVGDDGTFSLPYLESGTYELHFISYQEDNNGKLKAKGELVLNLIGSTLNLLSLNVSERDDVNVDVSVSGILFF